MAEICGRETDKCHGSNRSAAANETPTSDFFSHANQKNYF